MPHCIVEYSETLNQQIEPSTLLSTVFETVACSPLFDRKSVRARLLAFSEHIVATEEKDFIHITIKLYKGRSDKEKKLLNEQIGKAIEEFNIQSVKISVECLDIHTPSVYPPVG